MMPEGPWHILTGEYPPRHGGVSDYTAQVALGLAETGAEVHVWAPTVEGVTDPNDRFVVHRTAGRWSPADLDRLDRELDAFAAPRRLVVQYTPNAWGYKGLNLHFCRWLLERRKRGDDVRPMFHEVWYFVQPWDRPTRWLLAAGQRWMVRRVLAASSMAYVSIPYWEKLLRAYEPGHRRPMTWLPVPSNIPVIDDAQGVAKHRGQVAPEGQRIVGSFGTFSGLSARMLSQVLPELLRSGRDRVGLLIGRGGKPFADRMIADHPELTGRLVAVGGLPSGEVSRYLQACDVLIQPYPSGVSSRRGSVMAGLAHGVPIVSTSGAQSESIWAETGCLATVPDREPSALVEAAESLLASPQRRSELARASREVYERCFALRRTVETMIGSSSRRD